MEFEQCEIRVNRYDRGWLGPHWEFIAMARGPDGTYTVARTPRFPGYVPHWYYYLPLIKPDISYVELLENELSRGVLDYLIDHLRRTGWELLAGSGVHWYNRTFRRPIALYVPDPDPSTPYTLGDEAEWQQKVRKLLNRYEQRRNIKSCNELAKGLLQFGLALERIHQFERACTTYRQAVQGFEAISSSEEAAEATRRADRLCPQENNRKGNNPLPKWFQGPQPDLEKVLLAFLDAGTVDESVRILERSKDVLLTQTAFQVLQTIINTSRKDNPEDINHLEQKRRLLELARDMKDVQKAGQAMQRHLDEVRDAAVAFMIAKTDALRQTWEQHQKILLTTEGIRRAKRLAEQLKERERSGDSGDPRRHRVREFRVRYLEDARAHDIDYAQRHYYEGLGEIF